MLQTCDPKALKFLKKPSSERQTLWLAVRGGKRSGAWIKLKFHQEQEFLIGGYTEPEGGRKYFGALLVGVYEGKKLIFVGRVGTGFTENLLLTLFSELNQIRIKECPFINLPAVGRSRWDQGLTAAEMKRCHWVKPAMSWALASA